MLVNNSGSSVASQSSGGVLSSVPIVLSSNRSFSDPISTTHSTSSLLMPSDQPTSSTTFSVIRSAVAPPVEPQDSDIMSDVPSTPVKDSTSTATDLSVPEPPTTTTSPLTTSTKIKPPSPFSSAKTSPKPINTVVPQTLSGGTSEQASNGPKSSTDATSTKTTTKVSVETPKTTIPTSTSTITDQADSTFSSLVAISVTNPENGKASLSTPAFVTVLSTSTQPDGGFVTFTHVIANPSITASSDSQTVVQTGFLANRGAVAGVFTVVGILACSIVFFLAVLYRRRRRRSRQRRWLASIQTQRPLFDNPFDGSHPPQMRSTSQDPGNRRSSTPFTPRESTGHHSVNSFNELDVASPVSPVFVPSPRRVPVPIIDPFEDTSSITGLVGFGIGYGHMQHNGHRLHSVSTAQSSPSIYPPSLPPSGDDDNTTDTIQSPISDYSSDVSYSKSIASGAPPRPPRSPLRRSLIKPVEIYPITPPSSVSSHTPPSSPIVLDATKVVNRRTLLDVRPHTENN